MAVQSTAHRPSASSPSVTDANLLRGALRIVPWWVKWLAIFFAINTAASSILLFSRASGTSSALDQLPLDDSWIHLVYIRALVTEGCLCYNTGIWEAGATSWAWVFFNAPFYLVGVEWLGIDPVFVVKFVGLVLASVASLFAFLLVKQVTGNHHFALVAVALIAFEPTFAFSRISGMEIPIVVAAVLGTTLALANRRYRLAGFGLAISFFSRPEAGLFVAVVLVLTLLAVSYRNRRTILLLGRSMIEVAGSDNPKSDWVHARRVLKRATRSRSLLWLAVPPALSLLVWVGYNESINGTIYPNTYLAKHDSSLSFLPLANISNVFHWGVARWQPWLSGWVLPVTVLIYLIGSYFAVKRTGLASIPLLLFPLLLIIAVGRSQRFDEAEFLFWTRRYVDPGTPIMVMVLLLGVWAAFTLGRSYAYSHFSATVPRLVSLVLVVGLLATFGTVSINGSLDVWKELHHDNSWNTRNIADVDVGAGRWVDENLPADATVLVFDAGAIRFFGNRFTYDSVGLNFHELIGRPGIDQVITEQPDALAIWAVPQYENLPIATRQVLLTTPINTILGGGPVGVYTLDWERDDFVDASPMRLLNFDSPVIDSINLADKESEKAHSHSISFVAYAPNAIFELGDVVVRDQGLEHGGRGEVVERFEITAVPGEPLTLVLRHISDEQADFVQPRVFVDGQLAGQIEIGPINAVVQETAFTISPDLITGDRVDIEVRWNTFVTEFRWWAIAGEE